MRLGRIKILLLPGEAETIRAYSIPSTLIICCALFFLLSLAGTAWFLRGYVEIRNLVAQAAGLEEEIQKRQKAFVLLATRVSEIAKLLDEDQTPDPIQVADLEQYYSHLLSRTGPKVSNGSQDPGVRSFGVHREVILNLHTVMDYLDDRIELAAVGGLDDSGPEPEDLAQINKEEIKKRIVEIADQLELDPVLALSMAKVESGYNPKLVSPRGAVGVLQVMPRTASYYFGVEREELFHPETNIRTGLTWMQVLLKQFNENLDLSLAAYNAGVSRVMKAGYRVPPIPETRSYVEKVKQAMKSHQEALGTRPQVFK
ncbi:MAG: lytic transglycosylase domain-containing protein [Deltaproteobacteria bacterium]|nr:lytic transglycosylase domain-containing protein [Deltaproteobacteria bacterium]